MKVKKLLAALALSAVLLSSCSKDESGVLKGSYTYKISGTVTLMATALAGLDAATLAAYAAAGVDVNPVVVGLTPEQGQMNILEDEGRLILTMNNLLGNVDVADALADNGTITIQGTPTKAVTLTDGEKTLGSGIVNYIGGGKKIDDVLILDFQYTGRCSVEGIDMVVVASDVHCVAKYN